MTLFRKHTPPPTSLSAKLDVVPSAPGGTVRCKKGPTIVEAEEVEVGGISQQSQFMPSESGEGASLELKVDFNFPSQKLKVEEGKERYSRWCE